MATQTQYYNLDKPSYDEVADIEVINANMDKIDTQMRNNADGVNFAEAISSDAYDNSKSYAVGDYCIYNNKLYRCITAIESAEAFNIAKWEQTTVGNEVSKLNSNLDTTNANLLKKLTGETTNWLPEPEIDVFNDARIPNGISAYSVHPNNRPSQMADTDFTFGTIIIIKGVEYKFIIAVNVFCNVSIYSSDQKIWKKLSL